MTATPVPAPASLPAHRTIRAALRRAARAPSVHNTQPWRWVLAADKLQLHTDPDRLLASADPNGRQMIISCGAMLHHARTVFGALGWHTDTVRVPDPAHPEYLAEIAFRPWPNPPAGLVARAGVIERRRTDRLPMTAPEGWDALAHRLRMLASPHYIELDALDEYVRPRLAMASEQSAALRRYDLMYQAEIDWWAGHSDDVEGVPADALVSASEYGRVGVGRAFPVTPPSTRRAGVEDHARLVVFSSPGDSIADWLRTGEALSAVLLECTVAGLGTCPLTHLTEIFSDRTMLARATHERGTPQLVIRIGVVPPGESVPPTPRRPLADIFTLAR
ncbi:Acg family FMN-binding oxidoreductase [Nocardia crassostreae]|uniref:Acg family FMN-binding oxidoreductase n=1 Tax=Nocardia crassostreae TaxID=53428 RepID=UPI00082A17AD|nr:nitroreductase family protein [Nocardia crassostreae]